MAPETTQEVLVSDDVGGERTMMTRHAGPSWESRSVIEAVLGNLHRAL